MRWHIQGLGSLGCLWAARFAAAQQPVRLILRNPAALARYQKIGRVRLSDANQQHTQSYPISAQLPTHHEPIGRLLLACKAYLSGDLCGRWILGGVVCFDSWP